MQPTKKHSKNDGHGDKPILNLLTAVTMRETDPDRPRPLVVALGKFASATTHATDSMVQAGQQRRAEHDQLVTDAARGKLLEEQKQERQLTNAEDNIYKQSQSLLAAKPQVADFPAYMEKLQAYKESYATHRELFDYFGCYDSGVEQQLTARIAECEGAYKIYQGELKLERQRKAANEKQKTIHSLILAVNLLLDQGDLPAALLKLTEARDLATSIKKPEYIMPQSSYTAPEYFTVSLAILNEQITKFNARAKEFAPKIAQSVVEQAMLLVDSIRGEECLYTKHLADIKHAIQSNVYKFWHKFDSREHYPQYFENELTALIEDNIKPIGWIRYFEDRSKSSSVVSYTDSHTGRKRFPLIETYIPWVIARYSPLRPSLLYFYLPIFPNRVPVAQSVQHDAMQPVPAVAVYADAVDGASFDAVDGATVDASEVALKQAPLEQPKASAPPSPGKW